MEDLLDSNTTRTTTLVKEPVKGAGGALTMGIISIVLAGLIGIIGN